MSAPAASKKFTSFYRQSGMTYLDMLASASTALRRVLKEPQRTEALARSNFKYREFTYTEDKENPPSGCPPRGAGHSSAGQCFFGASLSRAR